MTPHQRILGTATIRRADERGPTTFGRTCVEMAEDRMGIERPIASAWRDRLRYFRYPSRTCCRRGSPDAAGGLAPWFHGIRFQRLRL